MRPAALRQPAEKRSAQQWLNLTDEGQDREPTPATRRWGDDDTEDESSMATPRPNVLLLANQEKREEHEREKKT